MRRVIQFAKIAWRNRHKRGDVPWRVYLRIAWAVGSVDVKEIDMETLAKLAKLGVLVTQTLGRLENLWANDSSSK